MLPHLPAFPFVVIDTNVWRRPEILRPLFAEFATTGQRILVPRLADYEMVKSESDAPTAIINATQILAECPEAIALARPTPLLFDHERRALQQLPYAAVVDKQNTPSFATIVRIAAREGAARRAELEALAADARNGYAPVIKEMKSATTIRTVARVIAASMSKGERAIAAKSLDRGDRTPLRANVAEAMRGAGLAALLEGVKYTRRQARLLSRFPSFSILAFVAHIAQATRWHVEGGLASFPDEKLLNEAIDLEHALLASYGRQLYTRDDNARELYEDILAIAHLLWPAEGSTPQSCRAFGCWC